MRTPTPQLQPHQLPLTVIVLVGSKTKHLPETLRSVEWASEIILFDNNSGFDFTQIAIDSRVMILFDQNPITDFAATRQMLQAKATQPWVFFVDSDEVVILHSLPELQAVLQEPALHGLSTIRSDVFLGKQLAYGEAGSQAIIRLVRPEYCTWQNQVHEVAEIDGSVSNAPMTLLHHSHESITAFIAEVTRYARLAALHRTSNSGRNLLELILFPPLKLLYSLVVQGGVLDGWRGVVYACCMSLHSLLVRVYWYETHNVLEKPRT